MPKRPEIRALNLSGFAAPDDRHPVEAFTDDDAGRIVNIPIAAIVPNPDQPRTYFDAQALHDLTESVRERGILQPIIVRRGGATASSSSSLASAAGGPRLPPAWPRSRRSSARRKTRLRLP
jgi:hypothetical protein